jgi:subtilase family serine protease
MSGALLSGCGRGGGSGPGELFADSVVGAIMSSRTPDLWVSSVSGPPSATSGSRFFVTVTACNQGMASASSTVELRLSADSLITAEDPLVGSAPTGLLHPKQCATLHVQTRPASVPDGLWYVAAVIDPGNSVSETTETNNTLVGARMAFGSGADLHISRVSTPVSLSPSSRFETAVTVCNTGNASASALVEVYLSADTVVTPSDTRVGSSETSTLRPGQCTELAIPSSAHVPEGQWYAAAWVDRTNEVPELVESNNTRLASQATLVGSAPDFTLAAVSGPASIPSDGALTLTATVCNQGTRGGATSVEGYLSQDTRLTAADILVGRASVGYLEPGQCAPVSLTGPVSAGPGQWYLAAWVDKLDEVPELLEDNNTRLGDRVLVGNGADLIVSEVRGPDSVAAGQPVRATATVCNQGTSSSPSSSAAFYLSLDATINTADILLGSTPVPPLEAGECAPVEVSGPANGHDGSWYVGVIADSGHGVAELLESNNTRAGPLLVLGDGGDLVISDITGPANGLHDQPFTGQITVCNQGTGPTGSSARAALYLSLDTAITAADILVGDVELPPLEAGQCTTASITGGASVPEGTWYLGAIADLYGSQPELAENNNTRVGSTLVIGPAPDMITVLHAPTGLQPGHLASGT